MNKKERFKYIFLITVDCLRADHVGAINKSSKLTPNIDKIARESIVFTRAFANGPGTNQSFPSIFTSTYFLMHNGFYLNKKYKTIAEVLAENGYYTVGFHSNPFLSRVFGWDKGFIEYYDFYEETSSGSSLATRMSINPLTKVLIGSTSKVIGSENMLRLYLKLRKLGTKIKKPKLPYLDGKKLNEKVFKWIEQNKDKNFFLWMHYMDVHYPYAPPEEYLPNEFSSREEALKYNLKANYINPSKEENEIFKKLYSGAVKYVDYLIGELYEYLRTRNMLEKSLLIITADHGHAFMEHGRFGHAYDILYNEVIHVPLLIYNVINKRKITENIDLLSLSPTILDILGIEIPVEFMGRSLIEELDHVRIIFSESAKPDLINLRYNYNKIMISCINQNIKLIINEIWNKIEMYNIRSDFKEKYNIIKTNKKLYNKLKSLVQDHLHQCNIVKD